MVKKARIANDFFCTLRSYSAKKPCQHDLSLRTAQRYYLAIFLQRIFTEFCPGRTWSWIFVWNAPAPSCLARFCILGKHWSLELEKFDCSEMDVNSRKISLYVEKNASLFGGWQSTKNEQRSFFSLGMPYQDLPLDLNLTLESHEDSEKSNNS